MLTSLCRILFKIQSQIKKTHISTNLLENTVNLLFFLLLWVRIYGGCVVNY